MVCLYVIFFHSNPGEEERHGIAGEKRFDVLFDPGRVNGERCWRIAEVFKTCRVCLRNLQPVIAGDGGAAGHGAVTRFSERLACPQTPGTMVLFGVIRLPAVDCIVCPLW